MGSRTGMLLALSMCQSWSLCIGSCDTESLLGQGAGVLYLIVPLAAAPLSSEAAITDECYVCRRNEV